MRELAIQTLLITRWRQGKIF